MSRLRQYIEANLADKIPDIANHGCARGVPELAYYIDSTPLYNEYESDIWDVLTDIADALDKGVLTFVEEIAQNNNLSINDVAEFKQWCLWIAVESVCQEIQRKK